MWGLTKGQRDLMVVSTALKILLFPAYRSTDFEVHRNWLGITHNLPLKEWYYEATSQWTLDYPPFFAYFSYLLTIPARLLPHDTRSQLLGISSTPLDSPQITVYMRSTVLISELVLSAGLLRLGSTASKSSASQIISLGIALHPGFLILDSIHFQYNAFLFGIMVWSLVGAKENRPIVCAFFFATLLNLKHIYVYFAPAWFVYLLRAYCIPPEGSLTLHLKPLLYIGTVTIFVFAISLGPFLVLGQGSQLFSRLFPFTRGLMHAYWAPNAWAGVTLLDRILLQIGKRLHLHVHVSKDGIASTSRGLVGDTHFAILPNVKPVHCFLLTTVTQMVQLVPLWRRPNYTGFLQAIAACGFSSFMFGWHVHEKAVMLILVPLSLLALEAWDWNHYQAFLAASISGIIGLSPLLFKAAETPVKVGYSVIWMVLVVFPLRQSIMRYSCGSRDLCADLARPVPSLPSLLLDKAQALYLYTAPILLVFTSALHPVLTKSRYMSPSLEFLPLMTTSVWCSVGLWLAWIRLSYAMYQGSGGVAHVDIKID